MVGNNENKNIYIIYIFSAEIWKGYCPNRVVSGGLYCNTRVLLKLRWLESGWFKGNCIATWAVGCWEIVLQYN